MLNLHLISNSFKLWTWLDGNNPIAKVDSNCPFHQVVSSFDKTLIISLGPKVSSSSCWPLYAYNDITLSKLNKQKIKLRCLSSFEKRNCQALF